MANSRHNNRTDVPSARTEDVRAPTPARPGEEELLDQGQARVISMRYAEVVEFSIEGDPYDAWMPRIARGGDGLVPVLPIRLLEGQEEAILILPGAFHSWIRREQPRRGTRLRLIRKGVDPDTGAWKLAVVRL